MRSCKWVRAEIRSETMEETYMICRWQEVFASCRHDTHQLLVRLERRSEVELEGHLVNALEI